VTNWLAPTAPLLDCEAPFVARAPSPYREAITLTDLRGLTQQAAAEMSGVTCSQRSFRCPVGRARVTQDGPAESLDSQATTSFGLLRNISETPLERPQLRHLLFDLLQVCGAHRGDALARHLAASAQRKNLADLVEREAQLLRPFYKTQLVEDAVGVHPVPG
jgi:hypothetical protein